jgi:hypothetical protein
MFTLGLKRVLDALQTLTRNSFGGVIMILSHQLVVSVCLSGFNLVMRVAGAPQRAVGTMAFFFVGAITRPVGLT